MKMYLNQKFISMTTEMVSSSAIKITAISLNTLMSGIYNPKLFNPKEMDEIYSRLVAKGTLYSIENYLEKFFINIFRSFYTDCSYDEFKNFAIPEDYVWFMEKTGNSGIAFYEIDQYIYGLYQMIYDTIYEMK